MPMYLMHHAFRRDLAAFAVAVATTGVNDRRRWRRLGRRWDSFARILHLHHQGEDDVLWPLLLGKVDAAGDATGRATLEAMEAEHDEIDPLLAGCAAGLAALAAGSDADTRALWPARRPPGSGWATTSGTRSPRRWRWCSATRPPSGRRCTRSSAGTTRPGTPCSPRPGSCTAVPAELRPAALAFIGPGATLAWRLLLRVPFAVRERRDFGASRA